MATGFGEFRGNITLDCVLKRRLLFVLLRVALAILLLSDVSIQPTYTEVYESPVLYSGLSPINATVITQIYDFNGFAINEFFWYYNTIFSDTRNTRVVEPLNCPSEEVCISYFMPGSPSKISADRSQPQITTQNFTDATSFIQHDAPGYQLDFHPIENDDPPMSLTDCKLYGTSSIAIQICLQQVNASFIAGNLQFSSITHCSVEFVSRGYNGGRIVFKHDKLGARGAPKYENDHLRTSSYICLRSLQPHNSRYS